MNTMQMLPRQNPRRIFSLIVVGAMGAATLVAQAQAPRISREISSAQVSTLKGSLHPLAQSRFDAGRVPPETRIGGISMVFSRSAAQQADLDALLAAQQSPASPLYHQWLNPDQFAARFGMAQADLDTVANWLGQQGFSIDTVARSRNLIRFSGNVRQVEQAFQTQMHYYTVGGARHFAPSSELSLPSALAGVVAAVGNLNDFRPKSQVVLNKTAPARTAFTSSVSGNVYFAPGDIATVYDIKPLYHSGYTGAGQTIAVVGQSAIAVTDIENFQSAAGLTVKDPALVLVPNTGTATYVSGDETESDLDLEWSSAIAPGADVTLVYTGSNTNDGAFDALQYAVDQKIAQVLAVSYGACEPELAGYSLESTFQQAAAQGQTILAASGDQGSTACYVSPTTTNPSLAIQQEQAVNYPASSPYVTGMGGTEIIPADDLSTNPSYWVAQSSTDVLTSAIAYIPEVTWNDDSSTYGLSATGGGASSLFSKPSWQTGVAGIPADSKRDVPDLALYSSPNYPGYIYCTSDTSAWSSSQRASCNSGFRDATSGALTVAGGTSFAAPIFAGMLALINQEQGYTGGQGLINPTLYTLAANSATYASAFHDVTNGSNDCTAGSTYCTSAAGFSAAAGYDQATGLGSVDLANLVAAWPASSSSLIGTTTTVAASSTAPLVNVSDNFTISVTSDTGSTVPAGTVSIVVDGGTPITGNTLTANGTFVYSKAFTTAGTHQVIAQYSGDATHAASTGFVAVNIAATSSGGGTFALAATPATLTVTSGATGTEAITVTPAGGYTGTVLLSFATSNDTALTNLCYEFTTTLNNGNGSVVVSNASAVATQLIFDTKASDCASAKPRTVGGQPLHRLGSGNTRRSSNPNPAPLGIAFAGLLMAGFLGRKARRFSALAGLFALLSLGLAVTACGGSISSTTVSNPPSGTYTITVTGRDSASSTIPSATTTFTFVIQ